MVLSSYQTAVQCRGTFENDRTSASIFDDMEVTQATQIFGPISDPAAEVTLPAVVSASKIFLCKACAITVVAHIDCS